MTNEAKSTASKFLLVLAAILSVVVFTNLHYMNGESVFITQVQNWDAIVWTQNIIEFIIVWVVFFAAKSTVLRQGVHAEHAAVGTVAGPPLNSPSSAAAPSANAFCGSCGKPMGSGDKFCGVCGAVRASATGS